MPPMQQLVEQKLQISPQTFELSNGMANAAYAFGTVLAVQLAMRLPQRRLLAWYAVLLLAASASARRSHPPCSSPAIRCAPR